MASMYRGKQRFTKEQVIFMCEVVIAAALDRIESCLPPCTPADEYKDRQLTLQEWIAGCEETCGMALATFYAQLVGDGIAICDALALIKFDEVVKEWIEAKLKDDDEVAGNG